MALREDPYSKDLTELIAKTYTTTQDPSHDQLLLKCAEPKKRGRTSDADRLKIPNRVDALRREYITPRKATEPPLSAVQMALDAAESDKYKVFMAILRLVHENALTGANYGAYLEKMNRLIAAKGIDWPMQSLVRAILNMESLLGITEIESIALDEGELYYCSYSGDCIKQGDQVYLIRILEYSHERHQKWRILRNKPNREFESPEFMASVRAFFVKKQFISLTGLWLRDFDDTYKDHHAEYFNKSPVAKRVKCEQPGSVIVRKDGHVWQRMNYMRNYILEHSLGHRIVKGKTFTDEVGRIKLLLQSITDAQSLRTNLMAIIEAYCINGETNALVCAVLDFIDVFYNVSGNLGPHDTEHVALRHLLNLSYERRAHPSYDATSNEFKKIDSAASDVNQYRLFSENHFLFLALFDYLFPSVTIKPDPDAADVLQLFGI